MVLAFVIAGVIFPYMLRVGDYVRHIRQGPGRVTEVLPDQVLVKNRSGIVFRVNGGIADQELQPVPADGFVALLFHRDFNAAGLQDNIEDVLRRIVRDRGRRSVPIGVVKAELLPFLEREGKKWASWWKSARRKLQSSQYVVVDPKRKVIETREAVGPPPSVVALAKASTSAELFQYARVFCSVMGSGWARLFNLGRSPN